MHPPNTQFGSPLWLPRATMMPSAWLFARRHMFPWCLFENFGPSNLVPTQERKHSSINFTWVPRHSSLLKLFNLTKYQRFKSKRDSCPELDPHGWPLARFHQNGEDPQPASSKIKKRAAGSYTLVSPCFTPPLTTDISPITRS